MPAAARTLLDDPERGLAELTTMMAAYFERAIAPWWPEIRAALEDDILHRARRLTAGGAIEVFEDLHHQVRWRDGVLEIDRPYEREVDLGGRGLLLVPAAFAWPRVFAMFDEPWQPALIYTPRGLGSLWAPPAAAATARRSRPCSVAAAPRSSQRSAPRRRRASWRGASAPRRPASTSTSASCVAPGWCAPPATGGASSTRARPSGDALLRRG